MGGWYLDGGEVTFQRMFPKVNFPTVNLLELHETIFLFCRLHKFWPARGWKVMEFCKSGLEVFYSHLFQNLIIFSRFLKNNYRKSLGFHELFAYLFNGGLQNISRDFTGFRKT